MNIFLHDAKDIYNKYDEGYVIISDSGEVLFGIDCIYDDEGTITGYDAYNSMGYGQWRCNTLKECIKVIEAAYNDTVIDRR